jgi:hypothetical protein
VPFTSPAGTRRKKTTDQQYSGHAPDVKAFSEQLTREALHPDPGPGIC